MENKSNKSLVDKIAEYTESHPYKSIICALMISVFLISSSALVMQLIVNSDIESGASNDGWISFYGGIIGGVLGGIGTIIAVLITTIQAKNHQNENLIETRSIQAENNKQILISNANEIIKDIREKIVSLKECEYILAKHEVQVIIDIEKKENIQLTECINSAKEICHLYDYFMKICGNIGTEEMLINDDRILRQLINYQSVVNDILKYYIENVNNMDDEKYYYINNQRIKAREIHNSMKGDILSLITNLQNKIAKVSQVKYSHMNSIL